MKPGGWYSHSVLATVLRTATECKLLFGKLEMTAYEAFMADDLVSGALVNQNNFHWIALVKHNGQLWHVDSRYAPWPMREEDFRQCLEAYPSTFAVAQREHAES